MTIALRMAEVTGKRGVIATDHTYHGNTTVVAQLAPPTARPPVTGRMCVRFPPPTVIAPWAVWQAWPMPTPLPQKCKRPSTI